MLAKVKILLGSFGEEIQVSDESYIDMATAVSGHHRHHQIVIIFTIITHYRQWTSICVFDYGSDG